MKFFFNMLVLNIESGPNERYTHDLSKFLENRFKGWNRNPRFEILHACVSPLILFVRHKGTCASSPFVRFITPLCFRIVTEMRRLCSTYTHGMRDNGRVRPLLGTFVCQRGTRGPPKAADDSSVNA